MRPKQLVKKAGYNESKEEAKNPGALLGLVMGTYPAMLIIALLVAIAFLGLRHGTTGDVPQKQSIESEEKAPLSNPIEGTEVQKEAR